MCCRNGPRRQPLVVTLGQYAYNKYQNRKQNQRALASGPSNNNTLAPEQVREHNANSEILEKSGIAPPPSYDTVVSGEPKMTGDGKKHDVDVIADDRDDLSDAESLSDRQGSADMEAAQADFIANWRASRRGEEIVVGRESKPLTKCQRRRAECAIRNAERAARRADRAVMGN